MKLHLPKLLLTAVLSTISAVSVSAQMSTPEFGGSEWTYNNGTFSKADGTTNNTPGRENGNGPVLIFDNVGTVTGNAGGDTSDKGGIIVTGKSVVTSNLNGWAGSIYVGKDATLNATYNRQLKNTEKEDVANVWVDGTLTFTGRDNIDISDTGNGSCFYQNWHIGENGLINFGCSDFITADGQTLNLEVLVDGRADLVGRTATGTEDVSRIIATVAADGNIFATLNSNCTIYDINGEEVTNASLVSENNTISVQYTASTYDTLDLHTSTNVAWTANGKAEGTLFKNANEQDVSFMNGDSVTVSNDATVTAQTNVTANTLTLDGGSVVANGHAITASSLVLSGSAGLDLSEMGSTLSTDSVSVANNTSLNLKGSWSIGTLTTEAYTFTKTGEGTLTLTNRGNLNGGTLNIEEGTVEVSINNNQGTAVLQNTTVNVSAGATFKSTGHDTLGYNGNHTKEIILTGAEGAGKTATFLNNETGTTSNTMGTNIVMNGYSLVTGTKLNTWGCSITANNSDNLIEIELQIRQSVTFTVNQDGELTISGNICNGADSNGTITVTGGGLLTVNHEGDNTYSRAWAVNGGTLKLTGSGAVSGTGAITVASGGTLSIAGDILLHQAITNSGTVSMEEGASLSFSSFEALGNVTGYGDEKTDSSTGSGYIIGDFKIIDGAEGANIGNTVKIDGIEFSTTIENGDIWVKADASKGGIYYVNGTVSYGTENNSASADTTTGIVLNGGTLEMTQSLNTKATQGIHVNQNSTVSLGDNVTLESSSVTVKDSTTLTLTGNGKYDLGSTFDAANKNITLGNGVSMGDNWTGTVSLKNLTIGGFANNSGAYITSLNSLSNANSWVQISGLTGYAGTSVGGSANGSSTITANLILDGDAITLTNGSSGSVTTFSGGLKGEGNIILNVSISSPEFKFTGDVSNWTGLFEAKAANQTGGKTYASKVTFSDSAKNIAATVKNTNSKPMELNITNNEDVTFSGAVNNDGNSTLDIVTEGTSCKTFSGGINASSLSVKSGSVVLCGDADKMNSIGSVTVSGGSNLILGTNNNVLTSVTIADGATLDATAYTTMGGDLTMSDGSILTISSENGLTLNGTLTLGTGLTLNISDVLSVASTAEGSGETTYTLAAGLTSIGDETSWATTKDATDYFSTININGYTLSGDALTGATLTYTDSKLSLITASVPEPTTSVLSILALGVLSLRRKRAK